MAAMFAPSLVTGHLVRMLGAPFLELLGAALIAAGAGVVLSGGDGGGDEGGDSTPSIAAFAASQALIGCGWNLCFVSATATLQQQTRPKEKVSAQAANDLAVFTLSGGASLLAAVALSEAGWASMQLAAFGTSGAIALAVGLSEVLARRSAAPDAAPQEDTLATPANLEAKVGSRLAVPSSTLGPVVVEPEVRRG